MILSQEIKFKLLHRRLQVVVQYAVVPLGLLVLWDTATRYGWVPNSLIASPSQVAVRMIEMLYDLTLFRHALVSLERLATGFLIGTTLGTVIGLAVGESRLGERLIEPTLLTLLPVPPIAWIPLLIILLGIGDVSKIALISLGSFFTLFLSTAYAVRTVDHHLIDLARVFAKGRMALIFEILLPASLPGILSSMRGAMALSWTLLICSEVIASSSGLGWLIWDARNFSRADDMIVGIITIGLLGKASDKALDILERRLTRWRTSYRDLSHV